MTDARAVIFDLDGCLVDSEVLSLTTIADMIGEMGLTADWRDLRGRHLGRSLPDISQDIGVALGRPCPPDFAEQFEKRLFSAYESALKPVPGADALLRGLQAAGVAQAIASGGSVRRIELSLKLVGLEEYFGAMTFSAEQVENGKPAPDLFLFAAKNLGVAARDCVVLEDSPHGVKGAVAAGMRAVGFVGGGHLEGMRDSHAEVLKAAGAETVIRDLAELEGLVIG